MNKTEGGEGKKNNLIH